MLGENGQVIGIDFSKEMVKETQSLDEKKSRGCVMLKLQMGC